MNLNRNTLALIFAAIIFALGLALNQSFEPAKSIAQVSFENWLEQVERSFASSDDTSLISPALKVRVFDLQHPDRLDYQLASSDFPDAAERLIRILHVAEEINLFSTTSWRENAADGTLALTIERGTTSFKTQLADPAAQSDIKLKTMLKLFQLYALERESKRAEMLAKNSSASADPAPPQTN